MAHTFVEFMKKPWVRRVYSAYLQGYSVEEIIQKINYDKGASGNEVEINEIIDFCNQHFL